MGRASALNLAHLSSVQMTSALTVFPPMLQCSGIIPAWCCMLLPGKHIANIPLRLTARHSVSDHALAKPQARRYGLKESCVAVKSFHFSGTIPGQCPCVQSCLLLSPCLSRDWCSATPRKLLLILMPDCTKVNSAETRSCTAALPLV